MLKTYDKFFCSNECHSQHKYSNDVFVKRFFESVVKQENGCWLWIGLKNKKGYGQISYKSKMISVHRISWEIHNGKVLDGMHVCHTCDVRNCVNPAHLFLGTNKDNMQDRALKGRNADKHGENAGNSKLKEYQILEIRNLYLAGTIKSHLAEKYNVAPSTIKRIVTRQTWNHIT